MTPTSTILPPAAPTAPVTLEPLAVLVARLVPHELGLLPVPTRVRHAAYSATVPARAA
jgi:hypothetical protein